MIIVNTTFVLDRSVEAEALAWIKTTFIESARRRGALDTPQPLLTKVLDTETADSATYAIHIYFPDIETAQRWNDGFGAGLRRTLSQRYGQSVLTFHTFLEVTE